MVVALLVEVGHSVLALLGRPVDDARAELAREELVDKPGEALVDVEVVEHQSLLPGLADRALVPLLLAEPVADDVYGASDVGLHSAVPDDSLVRPKEQQQVEKHETVGEVVLVAQIEVIGEIFRPLTDQLEKICETKLEIRGGNFLE